jgi:broad-specificity NMP kinase
LERSVSRGADDTQFEPRERARKIVPQKIAANLDAFNQAVDAESLEAVDRFWRTNTTDRTKHRTFCRTISICRIGKAASETNRELAKREAA